MKEFIFRQRDQKLLVCQSNGNFNRFEHCWYEDFQSEIHFDTDQSDTLNPWRVNQNAVETTRSAFSVKYLRKRRVSFVSRLLQYQVKAGYFNRTIATRNNIVWKYGPKTPISFNLRKYVEKHCSGPYWVHRKKKENKASYNTDYIVPDLIDFFGDDGKEIKTQTEKGNIHNCKKYCTH